MISERNIYGRAGIESTAIVSPTAYIGSGVYIGHYAVIEDCVQIYDDCYIGHHSVIGSPGEYKDRGSRGRVVIEKGVKIREFVTVNAPVLTDETRIGRDCFVMNKTHIAHDCQLGNRVTIAPMTSLGGSVTLHSDVNIGMGVVIHPRLCIGQLVMIGMNATVTDDLPAYVTAVGTPAHVVGWNRRGMEKVGMSAHEIEMICAGL